MARYRLECGSLVDTEKAASKWEEDSYWDGSNNISVNTRSEWTHQTLYKSSRGRYWLSHWSQWQGSTAHAEWISDRDAARWLMANDHPLPDDLASHEGEVIQ